MLQYKWISKDLNTIEDVRLMVNTFKKINPTVGAFDTETTGLHIIKDLPFLLQFGFLDDENKIGYTYAVDIEKQPDFAKAVIKKWHKLAASLKLYLGHNVGFDLNMLENLGIPYTEPNISDTMAWIRHAHDALTEVNGGPPLSLKNYAAKYITPSAKSHEQTLARERTDIAKMYNNMLKTRLKVLGEPDPKYKAKSYTISVIQEIFKDPIMEASDLPEDIKKIYLEWLQEDIPIYLQSKITALVESDMIPYNKLNRERLTEYAHMDIVLTLEVYLKTKPAAEARGTYAGIDVENRLIYPLVRMERIGFPIDKEYLEASRVRLKEYIKVVRKKLYEAAGTEFQIGQHAFVKDLLLNKFKLEVESTGHDALGDFVANMQVNNPEHPSLPFIRLLQELRTLEKWYSAYILRFQQSLLKSDRIYPTINSVGTVSGRCTSDWQQMPKDAIKDSDGNELFSPRRIVKCKLVSIDFSQVELRVQAFYTILVNDPDLNMLRAYSPYKCYRKDNGHKYDFKNPDDVNHWDDIDEEGHSIWLHEEDGTSWEPVDLHGKTTEMATGLTKDDPKFKSLRSKIGKRVNFAKNYGAQRGKIRTMFPDKTEEEIDKINGAYYAAFPGVKTYHNYCYSRALEYDYTSNLYGIKYYGLNGHKLINTLVQGSAAYYLKEKIIKVDEYIRKNNLKLQLMFQIHDELLFIVPPEEAEEVYNIKHIMEDTDGWYIPIVAEVDASNTTWADKHGMNSVEEVREVLNSEV
ncbi:MAG: DNA polymerase [Clostridium sp.]|nr:DNA polymerase [Clostridium sp.]